MLEYADGSRLSCGKAKVLSSGNDGSISGRTKPRWDVGVTDCGCESIRVRERHDR